MSSLFKSIDETLASIRDDHESATRALQDRLFALETELTMHKALTFNAMKERDQWMRLATKLVTQFGTVEQVFAEAKAMALQLTEEEAKAETPSEEKSASQQALDAAEHTFSSGEPKNGTL